MKEKRTIRYSEAFKLQVIRELEEGRFATPLQAQRAYGIRGAGTVSCWLSKYGKTHLLGKVVFVKTAREIDEVKNLRKEVRNLKSALADAHLDVRLERAYLEIACRAAGIEDLEGFKKKNAEKLSR